MNRLQNETSPYLLQHAHNPVDWYAWGEEALERARNEEKPILISIGYSTCHWCHVMERESFEDARVADYMNEHFINIKVDREERPDLDHIYMEACQAINGSGGWPLNAFLLPDARPFYAGTYYPPRPAHGRPSWLQLLEHLLRLYHEEREKVEEQARRLTRAIGESGRIFRNDELLLREEPMLYNPVVVQNLYHQLQGQFDQQYGGFGGAPKFPGTMTLEVLLDYHYFTGNEPALEHVHRSLEHMIRGGIYDQLGGGFARYATDRAWLIPHFEKMLYDNALLVGLLGQAHRLDPRPLYRQTLLETLDWLEREMLSPEGGFYSALDADSEGVEGKFYVWDAGEVVEVLGDQAAAPLLYYYGLSAEGNWEGTNILWRPQTLETAAAEFNTTSEAFAARIDAAREQLLAHREQRIRPGRDEKILLSWNAMMVSGLTQAYRALGNERYRNLAVYTMDFLLRQFARADALGLFHTYTNGRVQHRAYLDDYAYLTEALLDLYEITFDIRYIERAKTFTEYTLAHFLDATANLFYFTEAGDTELPVRRHELYDSATPSGNSVMVMNLMRLGQLLENNHYRELADRMLRPLVETLERYPGSFPRWVRALLYRVYPGYEVAVTGPAAPAVGAMLTNQYLPNTVIMAADTPHEEYPLLAHRHSESETRIFVCRAYACEQPVTKVEEALRLLRTSGGGTRGQ